MVMASMAGELPSATLSWFDDPLTDRTGTYSNYRVLTSSIAFSSLCCLLVCSSSSNSCVLYGSLSSAVMSTASLVCVSSELVPDLDTFSSNCLMNYYLLLHEELFSCSVLFVQPHIFYLVLIAMYLLFLSLFRCLKDFLNVPYAIPVSCLVNVLQKFFSFILRTRKGAQKSAHFPTKNHFHKVIMNTYILQGAFLKVNI